MSEGNADLPSSDAVRDLNVAVVGYGYWGPNLVRNFANLHDARMHTVVDQSADALRKVRKLYPAVQVTQNYEEVLANDEIDAVAIATPAQFHFPMAMAALKAGKHVWLEKPMTETSAQAEQLVHEARRRGLVLMVDHTFVYSGPVRKMAELIHGGKLGNIYYYDSTRVNLGLFQRDVSVISDLAVHDFSILDYLFRREPTSVSATGINHFAGTPENLAYITLFYDSSFIAHINVSWLSPVKVRLILVGASENMIAYDDLDPSEKLKIYDKGVSFTDDPEQIYQMRVGYRVGDMLAPTISGTEALQVATSHFVDCIRRSATPITDGRFGLRMVKLIEAATRSMQCRGETVSIETWKAAE
jgi:predicted dehydrogenase